MGQTYKRPTLDGVPVRNLIPESADGNELTPATPVLVVHRGRHVITDKFDGRDYRIEPGYTEMPYGAAVHFQSRAVIPGTRNPEIGSQQSYLGICGIDDAPMCEPLTNEEVTKYGAAVEAIDREALGDTNTHVIKSGVPGQRGRGSLSTMRPKLSADQQATDGAAAAAADIMAPPGQTDAQVDAAEAGGRTMAAAHKKTRGR